MSYDRTRISQHRFLANDPLVSVLTDHQRYIYHRAMRRYVGSRVVYVLSLRQTGIIPERRVSDESCYGMPELRKPYSQNNNRQRIFWQIPARRDAEERSCFFRQQFLHRLENIVLLHCT